MQKDQFLVEEAENINPLEQFADDNYCIDLLVEFFVLFKRTLDREDKKMKILLERSQVSPELNEFMEVLLNELDELVSKADYSTLTEIFGEYDRYLTQILLIPTIKRREQEAKEH